MADESEHSTLTIYRGGIDQPINVDLHQLPNFGVCSIIRRVHTDQLPDINAFAQSLDTLMTQTQDPEQKAAKLCALALILKQKMLGFSKRCHDGVFQRFDEQDTIWHERSTNSNSQPDSPSPSSSKNDQRHQPKDDQPHGNKPEVEQRDRTLRSRLKELALQKDNTTTDAKHNQGSGPNKKPKTNTKSSVKNKKKNTKPTTKKDKPPIPDPAPDSSSSAGAGESSDDSQEKITPLIPRDKIMNMTDQISGDDMVLITNKIISDLTGVGFSVRGHEDKTISEEQAIQVTTFFCGELTGLDGLKNASSLIADYQTPTVDGYDHGQIERLDIAAQSPDIPDKCAAVLLAMKEIIVDETEEGRYLKSFRKQVNLANMIQLYNELLEVVDDSKKAQNKSIIDPQVQHWIQHKLPSTSKGRGWDTQIMNWMEAQVSSGARDRFRRQLDTGRVLLAAQQVFGIGIFVLAPPNLYVKIGKLGGRMLCGIAYEKIIQHHPFLQETAAFFTKHVAIPINNGARISLHPIDWRRSSKAIKTRYMEALPSETQIPQTPPLFGWIEEEEDMVV